MKLNGRGALVCLAVLAFAASPLFARSLKDSPPQRFGPEALWTLPREALFACLEKTPDGAACLTRVMRQTGASQQALAFCSLLDGEGYMRAFHPKGLVNLAIAEFPLRANTNEAAILVGGTPPLVSSELADTAVTLNADPLYPALKQRFPDLELWPASATFRAMKRLPDGGQSFEFAYPLRNGCHACALAGYALVALDFGPDGIYRGPRLIRLEHAQ